MEICVAELGGERTGILPLAGVAGDCTGLAKLRFWPGVVLEERVVAGAKIGDERLSGLFIGIDEFLDVLPRDLSGVAEVLRCCEDVVRDSGLKL